MKLNNKNLALCILYKVQELKFMDALQTLNE